MKFSIFVMAALAGFVTAQSCAGGAGFCDGSGHCQDGSGVVSPDVDPDCVGGGAAGGVRGGRGSRGGAAAAAAANNDIGNSDNSGNGAGSGSVQQGAACAGGAGFCDGSGHCQDGSGVVSPDVDPACFA